MKLILLISALFLASHAMKCPSATYKLTFTSLFFKPNIPLAPGSAHLSPLTAFSHNRRFSAFVLYGYATPGVQDVAETGANGKLIAELDHPLVKDIAKASGPIFGEGDFVLELEVDCNSPFISAISMIAPSPDWIVAFSGLDMRDEDTGEFVPLKEGMLKVYDAGTDSGTTLTAKDEVTDPQENIHPLEGAPFFGEPAASYKLELVKGGSGSASGEKPCKKGPKGKNCRRKRRKASRKE